MIKCVLVVHLTSGPFVMEIDALARQAVSEWLMSCMETNEMAVFKTPTGLVLGAARGNSILGFTFEPGVDPEVAALGKRRLEAEVSLMEKSLKQQTELREGDEWKRGYDENDEGPGFGF